jgi:hypothetical protein
MKKDETDKQNTAFGRGGRQSGLRSGFGLLLGRYLLFSLVFLHDFPEDAG